MPKGGAGEGQSGLIPGLSLIPTPAAAEVRDRRLSAHSRLGDRSSHGLNGHSSLRVQGIAPCYTC